MKSPYDEEPDEEQPELNEELIHLAENNFGIIHKDIEANIVTLFFATRGFDMYFTLDEWKEFKRLMFIAMSNDKKVEGTK